jgi:hypothetical protein
LGKGIGREARRVSIELDAVGLGGKQQIGMGKITQRTIEKLDVGANDVSCGHK